MLSSLKGSQAGSGGEIINFNLDYRLAKRAKAPKQQQQQQQSTRAVKQGGQHSVEWGSSGLAHITDRKIGDSWFYSQLYVLPPAARCLASLFATCSRLPVSRSGRQARRRKRSITRSKSIGSLPSGLTEGATRKEKETWQPRDSIVCVLTQPLR